MGRDINIPKPPQKRTLETIVIFVYVGFVEIVFLMNRDFVDWAGESAMAGSERYTAGDSAVRVTLTSRPAALRALDCPVRASTSIPKARLRYREAYQEFDRVAINARDQCDTTTINTIRYSSKLFHDYSYDDHRE